VKPELGSQEIHDEAPANRDLPSELNAQAPTFDGIPEARFRERAIEPHLACPGREHERRMSGTLGAAGRTHTTPPRPDYEVALQARKKLSRGPEAKRSFCWIWSRPEAKQRAVSIDYPRS